MAEAPALSRFITALRRDRISYQLSSAWHPDDEVVRVAQQIRDQRSQQAQATQRSVEESNAERVAREERQRRAAEDAATRTAQLRRTHGPRATALLNQLRTSVDALINPPADFIPLDAANLFPFFAREYGRQTSGGWELEQAEYLVHEFGESIINDRLLETIFVQVRVRMKHRDLGRYENHCFILGYQNDTEFNRLRSQFDQTCDAAPPQLANWMAARRYQSLWTVRP